MAKKLIDSTKIIDTVQNSVPDSIPPFENETMVKSDSCALCQHFSAGAETMMDETAVMGFSQWMIVVFAAFGVLMLIISLLWSVKRRTFQKNSVVCFLLMAGFCANSELCWIVIAILLVAMLLKFDAITKWIEALESEPTKKP